MRSGRATALTAAMNGRFGDNGIHTPCAHRRALTRAAPDRSIGAVSLRSLSRRGACPKCFHFGTDIGTDNHHRFQCDPRAPTRIERGLTEAGKKAFVLRSNVIRRNLSDAQWIDVAFKVEPLIAAKAKANQKLSEGRGKKGFPMLGNLIHTDKQLAELAGVGHGTVDKQRFVRDHDAEKYAELVKPGSGLSINRAYLDVSQPSG